MSECHICGEEGVGVYDFCHRCGEITCENCLDDEWCESCRQEHWNSLSDDMKNEAIKKAIN